MQNTSLAMLVDRKSEPASVRSTRQLIDKIDSVSENGGLIDSGLTILDIAKMIEKSLNTMLKSIDALCKSLRQFDDISYIQSPFVLIIDSTSILYEKLDFLFNQADRDGACELLSISEAETLSSIRHKIDLHYKTLLELDRGIVSAIGGNFCSWLSHCQAQLPRRKTKENTLDIVPIVDVDTAVMIEDITEEDLSNMGISYDSID